MANQAKGNLTLIPQVLSINYNITVITKKKVVFLLVY